MFRAACNGAGYPAEAAGRGRRGAFPERAVGVGARTGRCAAGCVRWECAPGRWCPGGECWLGGCVRGGGWPSGRRLPGKAVRMIREPGPGWLAVPLEIGVTPEPLVAAPMSRMPHRRQVRPGENGSTS